MKGAIQKRGVRFQLGRGGANFIGEIGGKDPPKSRVAAEHSTVLGGGTYLGRQSKTRSLTKNARVSGEGGFFINSLPRW